MRLSPSLIGLLVACGGDAGVQSAVTVRDSAGVEIVESSAPQWSEGEAWALSAEPLVTIGVLEGDTDYLLSDARGARRLEDGRIAVLDVGSASVRLYDETGTHIRDIGGRGEGPGELQIPQHMALVDDTIVVHEYFPGSMSWYLPDGTFVRKADTPTGPDGNPTRSMMFGSLAGGKAIAHGIHWDLQPVLGLNRTPRPIWLFDLSR